jgi:hypothetical protein
VFRKKVVAAILAIALISTTALTGCGGGAAANDKNQYLNIAINAEPGTLD